MTLFNVQRSAIPCVTFSYKWNKQTQGDYPQLGTHPHEYAWVEVASVTEIWLFIIRMQIPTWGFFVDAWKLLLNLFSISFQCLFPHSLHLDWWFFGCGPSWTANKLVLWHLVWDCCIGTCGLYCPQFPSERGRDIKGDPCWTPCTCFPTPTRWKTCL